MATLGYNKGLVAVGLVAATNHLMNANRAHDKRDYAEVERLTDRAMSSLQVVNQATEEIIEAESYKGGQDGRPLVP